MPIAVGAPLQYFYWNGQAEFDTGLRVVPPIPEGNANAAWVAPPGADYKYSVRDITNRFYGAFPQGVLPGNELTEQKRLELFQTCLSRCKRWPMDAPVAAPVAAPGNAGQLVLSIGGGHSPVDDLLGEPLIKAQVSGSTPTRVISRETLENARLQSDAAALFFNGMTFGLIPRADAAANFAAKRRSGAFVTGWETAGKVTGGGLAAASLVMGGIGLYYAAAGSATALGGLGGGTAIGVLTKIWTWLSQISPQIINAANNPGIQRIQTIVANPQAQQILNSPQLQNGGVIQDALRQLTHMTEWQPPAGPLMQRLITEHHLELIERFDGTVRQLNELPPIHPYTGRPSYGSYDPATNTITLYRGADWTTSFHELLHWADVTARMQNTGWTRQQILQLQQQGGPNWQFFWWNAERVVNQQMLDFGFTPVHR